MSATRVRFTVEATAAAVRGARRRVSATVRSWGVSMADESLLSLEVVASELLTNALVHAGGGAMTVELSLDQGLVVVTVLDGSTEVPRARAADPDQEGGRGLVLIDGLCLLHGVERTAHGKRCWAVVPVPAVAGPAPGADRAGVEGGAGPEYDGTWSLTDGGAELLSRLLTT
ncbi:ATP-binding protein [Streptomyces sp. NPDC045251]|uniref:ATP-binding protein n=1 Tax=unclassified Streptomyces TaxID=2593676 RepID=UPI0033F741BD